jgi:hypothetical protein
MFLPMLAIIINQGITDCGSDCNNRIWIDNHQFDEGNSAEKVKPIFIGIISQFEAMYTARPPYTTVIC